ncbi:CidA/LrgA family protein [uncultured Granulicatella sp.]|uniref:CidA/LrgA family protein n=1 Tax=uncultured Granulicatella sp. TaxID=316089 RepID=UPI002609B93B|nr:CidA/LrgA family protein [uncultured Granulicatella sp.]
MKFFKQFGWIMFVTCLGEILKYLLPFPIPASIYGLILMMIFLMTGLIKLDRVHQAGTFLIEIMALMFIPAAVGIIESWAQLQRIILPVSIITVITTIVVMIVSGRVTQFILEREEDHESTSH